MKVHYQIREMHTVVPFGITRGTTSKVNNLFLEIEEGIGEAAPTKFFHDTLDKTLGDIANVISALGDDPFQIDEILRRVSSHSDSRILRTAVDIALHDLVAKRLNIPLYQLFGLSALRAPQTSFTIGISETEDMIKRAIAVKQYPILKIKLGGPDDMNVMRKIREALPHHTLRVDCNSGWKSKDAIRFIDELTELKVEFVEQPLPPEDIDGLKKIFKESKLPIFLDESVRESSDIPKVAGYCHGVNIKLMKTGGLREAIRMIYTARAHGLQIMLGCMLESSVAITAAAHISPLVNYADLDGHLLLADDPYIGMTLDHGWIHLPDTPGLGVQPKKSNHDKGIVIEVA